MARLYGQYNGLAIVGLLGPVINDDFMLWHSAQAKEIEITIRQMQKPQEKSSDSFKIFGRKDLLPIKSKIPVQSFYHG